MVKTFALRAVAAMSVFAIAAVAQQPTAQAAYSLRGRVVDEAGKPVEGAAVALFATTEFVDTASLLAKPPDTSAADGTFTIALDGPATSRRLVVAARGRQGWAQTVHNSRESKDVGDVVLPPGARLSGRVRDENGRPIAGVRLRVETSIQGQASAPLNAQLWAGAVSNDKGIFSVPCVPRSGLKLVAECDGYVPETRLVAQESPTDLTLASAGVVRGRVVDGDGKPVAGARVRVATAERFEPASCLTGADGAFELTVPTRSRYRISAATGPATYSSDLLRGPADDVKVTQRTAAPKAARSLEVVAVDATTKAPLPRFTVGFLRTNPGNVQAALFHGVSNRKEYEGKAVLELPERSAGLFVEAPEHGFEVVPTPEDGKGPLVVELGPEAILRGRVLDAGTGKPMAGVAVRALPKGNTSGSGGNAKDAGPLSDANGDYCVHGLKPGEYGVQAHAEGRGASDVAPVTLAAGATATLELTVPAERWVDAEVTGVVPPGPAPTLRFTGGTSRAGGNNNGFFQHTLPDPPSVSLLRAGRVRLGPLTPGRRALQLFVPSRTRVGAGTSIDLEQLDCDSATATIALPDLTVALVKGRVELPSDVPTERIGVFATRSGGGAAWSVGRNSIAATGVDASGRFELDLPQGSYMWQLADLATGIVFHTEPEDLAAGAAELVLKPEIHWLAVACEPATPGAEVVVHSFRVTIQTSRDGARGFLEHAGFSNRRWNGTVPARALAASPRWLVPSGPLEIQALQGFELLKPGAVSSRPSPVDSASVDVDALEHRVQLTIPAPPSDEELQRR